VSPPAGRPPLRVRPVMPNCGAIGAAKRIAKPQRLRPSPNRLIPKQGVNLPW
jgi:hypothetical protein